MTDAAASGAGGAAIVAGFEELEMEEILEDGLI